MGINNILGEFNWSNMPAGSIPAGARDFIDELVGKRADVKVDYSHIEAIRNYVSTYADSILFRFAKAKETHLSRKDRFRLLKEMDENFDYINYIAACEVDLSASQRYTLANRIKGQTCLTEAVINVPELSERQRYKLALKLARGEDENICKVIQKADLSIEHKKRLVKKIEKIGYKAFAQRWIAYISEI